MDEIRLDLHNGVCWDFGVYDTVRLRGVCAAWWEVLFGYEFSMSQS